jgi:hypothetical protein
MNPARQAGIAAGLPVEVPALTANRVFGSGATGCPKSWASCPAPPAMNSLPALTFAWSGKRMSAFPVRAASVESRARNDRVICNAALQLHAVQCGDAERMTWDMVAKHGAASITPELDNGP